MFKFDGFDRLASQTAARQQQQPAQQPAEDATGVKATSSFSIQSAGPPDIVAGDITTSSTVAPGAALTGFINTEADQDWFKVSLVAGRSYRFAVSGSGAAPLTDSLVTLYDSTGALI